VEGDVGEWVMRVIFSGSREFKDREPVRGTLVALMKRVETPGELVVVHGAARGLDTIAGEEAKNLGATVESHPADWDQHGKAAGLMRNSHMVELGADLVVAFPLPGGSGTRDCMKKASKSGIPVLVYNAESGSIERWGVK
jgi:predicted Rossmann-fold nucleotide-binding protein